MKPGGEKGQEGDDAEGAQGLTAAAAQEKRRRKGTRGPQLRGTAAPLLAPRAPAGCSGGPGAARRPPVTRSEDRPGEISDLRTPGLELQSSWEHDILNSPNFNIF